MSQPEPLRDRAVQRLRLYADLIPHYALGEIAYDERFRSEEWPRAAYHPNRDDLLAALGEIDRLTALLADRPAPVTEYGLRLRDRTVLTFDDRRQRERRAREFEEAQWEITRLCREKRASQADAWTEETPDA